LDNRSAFILFRHPDDPYLVQCRASYDVIRTPAICGQEHGRSIPLADELLAHHLLYSDGINPYWVGILVFMIGVFTPVT
jgi:hypothetical protein